MQPRRRARSGLPPIFTFGGRVPASVGLILVAMAVLTIFSWQNRAVAGLLALVPPAIWSGEVWRLVTWFFVQGDPFGLIFVGLMFWWLAPQLMYLWGGEDRFLLRLLGITAGASLVTTAIALVWPEARAPHLGAWPTMNALLVAWAMRNPDGQVNIWGILPVTGRMLAIGVVAGTVLYALFGGRAGFGAFLPHFAAMGIAYVLTRGLLPRGFMRRAKEGMREREARRRAKHLKVVKKNGEDDRPQWMN
jgi:hypothetical protein